MGRWNSLGGLGARKAREKGKMGKGEGREYEEVEGEVGRRKKGMW